MTPCCLFADDEELRIDPEAYECGTCPVLANLEGLDAENRQAWGLYKRIVTRLAADLYCGAEVLRRFTADVSNDDFPDLWERLSLLYSVLNPVEKKDDHE